MLGKQPPPCVVRLELSIRNCSPSIVILLLSSNFLLCWGPCHDRPGAVILLFTPRPASTSGIPGLFTIYSENCFLSKC